MKLRLSASFVLSSLLFALSAGAANWPQFRGPGGRGSSAETGLPVKWSSTENIAWKVNLPGLGTSSPVVVGERIFLTCYNGYAEDPRNPGDMDKLMRYVVCLNRADGNIVWSNKVPPVLPESKYVAGNSSWHGYASSTPTSDGERLYVFFGLSGVYCFDLDGSQRWKTQVGSQTRGWGSGNSPILYQDLLIVNASVESNSLVALDKLTGKQVWLVEVSRGCRNTPALVDVPGGGTELVVNAPGRPEGSLMAYDPATGKELWRAKGIPDKGYVVPSAVSDDGIVYAIGGRQNTALAVRAGGRGDVTTTHQLWWVNRGSNVSSPVYHDGYLYWFHERRGMVYCLDGRTGKVVFEERLTPSPGIVYSSVLAADGKLYCVSQHNGTYVLAAKPKFELLAHNVFADDDSRTNASLVAHRGQLLLRNDKHLYCIGQK